MDWKDEICNHARKSMHRKIGERRSSDRIAQDIHGLLQDRLKAGAAEIGETLDSLDAPGLKERVSQEIAGNIFVRHVAHGYHEFGVSLFPIVVPVAEDRYRISKDSFNFEISQSFEGKIRMGATSIYLSVDNEVQKAIQTYEYGKFVRLVVEFLCRWLATEEAISHSHLVSSAYASSYIKLLTGDTNEIERVRRQ